MSHKEKRLRIFAGPNGSGKSTLYNYLVSQKYFNPYFYINPDDFAKNLVTGLNFVNWNIDIHAEKIKEFLKLSTYNTKTESNLSEAIDIKDKTIYFIDKKTESASYIAAALAEYFRHELITIESSFVFETVFSHPSKLDFIDIAKKAGYKTYLYFVSTDEPVINIERVKARAEQGGHFVEESKIESRYENAMKQLFSALQKVDEAFLFDNSTNITGLIQQTFNNFAYKKGSEFYFTGDTLPYWFNKYVPLNIN